ncbi:hypothetical protein BDY24DRAFT_389635 [Mrakia frigida]|uniref:uncharacterized protein n=1 Tax=Mrakia frigida TaxID=29902 RepID=UPI003FCC1A2F
MNNAPSAYVPEKKHTVFVSGLPEDVDEEKVLSVFVSFGDIVEIQLPREKGKDGKSSRHKGFAFLTYTSALDAQDAIDNYDLNYFPGSAGGGRVMKVNLAKAQAGGAGGQVQGNRAVWSSETWLKEHALPLGQSGGVEEARPETEEEKVEEEEVELEQ